MPPGKHLSSFSIPDVRVCTLTHQVFIIYFPLHLHVFTKMKGNLPQNQEGYTRTNKQNSFPSGDWSGKLLLIHMTHQWKLTHAASLFGYQDRMIWSQTPHCYDRTNPSNCMALRLEPPVRDEHSNQTGNQWSRRYPHLNPGVSNTLPVSTSQKFCCRDFALLLVPETTFSLNLDT